MKTIRTMAMWLAVGMFLGLVGVSAAPAGVVYTIDDEDAGYTPTGAWTQESGGVNGIFYYNGDEWYQSTPNNGATASWSFTGLPSGKYYLAASYYPNANRTSNAHYAISDGIPAADIDQRPNVYDLGGRSNQGLYRRLSTQAVSITDGTLDVAVSNTAGAGYLMADSVRLETARPDAVQVFVVDNRYEFEGRPGYSKDIAGWGFENEGHTDGEDWSNQAGKTATFDFTGLPDGHYRVSTTWVAKSNRSLDAVYTMTDGAGVAHVNQQVAPADETFDNVGWKMLDPMVHITDGTFSATLSNNDVGNFIMADAVRLEQVTCGIDIRNPSFEADTVTEAQYWTGTTTDWNDNWATNNHSGIINPPGAGTPPVPDGNNAGFLNGPQLGWMAQFLRTADGSPRSLGVGDKVSVTVQAYGGAGLRAVIRNPSNVDISNTNWQTTSTTGYDPLTFDMTVGTGEKSPLLLFYSNAGPQTWFDNVSATYTRAALIQNPSFEIDPLGNGGWTGVATDWSDQFPTNNDSGAYNPTTGPAVPDGANVGFLNLNGWVAQYLEELDGSALSLAAGDMVSVTLLAASRGGLAGGLLDVDIRTPGNLSIVGGLQQQVVGQNDFTWLTYDFTINAAEATPLLVLQNSTASDQLWVDSVSIRVAHGEIPEPATCALSALALAALGGYIRRRRKA